MQPSIKLVGLIKNLTAKVNHFKQLYYFFGMPRLEYVMGGFAIPLKGFGGNIQILSPFLFVKRGYGLNLAEQRIGYPLPYGINKQHFIIQKMGKADTPPALQELVLAVYRAHIGFYRFIDSY